jgi:hypothetical protein
MAKCTKEGLSRHVQSTCDDFNSSAGLPFRELLDGKRVVAALAQARVEFRERIFSPLVTLSAFLSQVIAQPGSSCEDAVSRVLADRLARGQSRCSSDSSSYCQARQRLPEEVLAALTRETGQELHRQAPSEWLWKGRCVRLVDGSTAQMDDTPENQAEYPQSSGQKAGLGFPILRFVVLLSLSVGTVLECALGACRGKHTGEQTLFRQIWDSLQEGEIVVGDRLFDCYRDAALLKARKVDVIFGKKQSRAADFRRGRKLGSDDHIVIWEKPRYDANRYESRAEWEALPDQIEMRETRLIVRRPGYRTRTIVVVTTLLDAETYSAEDLIDLFAQRWHCELDLRSIKRVLGMHHLRCKTPEMVRKELWAYLLAYNLIRVRMAQAAALHATQPRQLSFTAAKNHIHNFAPHFQGASVDERDRLERELLGTIASSRLQPRPSRKEPRAIKKRVQKYSYLTKPRSKARKQLVA